MSNENEYDYNKLYYRMKKAKSEGFICHACGYAHWKPAVENINSEDQYFIFKCEKCGQEWTSSQYGTAEEEISRTEKRVSEATAGNQLGYLVWQFQGFWTYKKIRKQVMKLEEGYDPDIDWETEYLKESL